MTNVKFENEAIVEGVVLESDVSLKEFTDNNTGNKYKALSGRMVIKTGENETHTAQYFVKELTAKGDPNKIFTNVKTVLDELVTIQDISQHPQEFEGASPTKVRVRGELSLNEYYDENEMLRSNVQIRGVFLNRVKDDTQFSPKAEYDIEGIVVKTIPEIDKDENETGRVKVTVLIPTYNSALPIEFISRAEDGDYIQDNFESGVSVNIYGTMVNFSKKIEIEKEAGFGQNKTETKWENTRELQIVGGKVFDEENPKTLQPEDIKELSAKRNVFLGQLKEKSQQRSKKEEKQVGFGNNTTPNVNTNTTKPKVDVSNLF